MKAVIKFFIFCCIASVSAFTHADLIWDWQFEKPEIGVVAPTDVVQGRAVVSVDINSTEAINSSSNILLSGMGLWNPLHNGDYAWNTETGFGLQEPFPWPNLQNYFYGINLLPGQSTVFDFIWVKSALPQGFESGIYSINAHMEICLDGCRDAQSPRVSLERTLSWSVTNTLDVPEPSAFYLFGIALGMLVCIRFRKTYLNNY